MAFDWQTRTLLNSTLEGIKSQRDLYIAMRDLFIRHDRLSVDQVERLKKRVDTTSVKLEGIRAVQKEGWEVEADKLAGAMEKDKVTITAQLNRRVFIRAWYVARFLCTPCRLYCGRLFSSFGQLANINFL